MLRETYQGGNDSQIPSLFACETHTISSARRNQTNRQISRNNKKPCFLLHKYASKNNVPHAAPIIWHSHQTTAPNVLLAMLPFARLMTSELPTQRLSIMAKAESNQSNKCFNPLGNEQPAPCAPNVKFPHQTLTPSQIDQGEARGEKNAGHALGLIYATFL